MMHSNTSAYMVRLARLGVTCCVIATLAACGGGGGDDATGPAPIPGPPPGGTAPPPEPGPPPPPISVNPDLVTNVLPATYPADSAEKGGWDLLLKERGACGFGLLNQDIRLDTASAAHGMYLAQNTIDNPGTVFTGHFESPDRPYYYAAAPWDRAARAGYPDSVTEIFSQVFKRYATASPTPIISNEAQGAETMRGLLHSVYHLSGAMYAGRFGGIGAINKFGPLSETRIQNMFVLTSLISDEENSKKQKLGSGVVATYPCDNLVGVGTVFKPAEESPNPFPEITQSSVDYGIPVYLKVDAGSTLVVDTIRIVLASNGTELPHRTLTKATDPAGHLNDNQFFMVPTAALASASTYTVTATGTVDGKAFTKTFSFQTR